MIQPGQMREDIIVQKKTTIKDNYGAEAEIFTDYLYLRASIKFASGSKGINNDEIFNYSTVTFTTYYRDINETMRILCDDKYYRITFLDEIGFREGYNIRAELINE
jgi:SPP1 family predicted phage head-tail adaptor